MRVILAAIIVMVGTFGFASLVVERMPPWLAGTLIASVMILLCIVVLVAFSWIETRFERKHASWKDTVADWERQGLLEKRTFRAQRAFSVEPGDRVDEDEDEGPMFFLELED